MATWQRDVLRGELVHDSDHGSQWNATGCHRLREKAHGK